MLHLGLKVEAAKSNSSQGFLDLLRYLEDGPPTVAAIPEVNRIEYGFHEEYVRVPSKTIFYLLQDGCNVSGLRQHGSNQDRPRLPPKHLGPQTQNNDAIYLLFAVLLRNFVQIAITGIHTK